MKKNPLIEKMNFLDQPTELILSQLRYLPIDMILNACEVNSNLAQICNTKTFWFDRLAEDFPESNTRGHDDPRSLYLELYHKQKQLQRIKVDRHVHNAKNRGPTLYWQVLRPARLLYLPSAIKYVQSNYPGREGFDRFVYWPDYQMAGTVNDIARLFKEVGIRRVGVGTLHQLSQGQLGTAEGIYPLSKQLIYDNSIDPLNPNQIPWIERISEQVQVTGFSNGSQNLLNRIIQSMTADTFMGGLGFGDGVFLGYQSYQEFIDAQINFVNGFNDESLRILELLMNQIVPVSTYLEDESLGRRSIHGLVFDKNGSIVFV